MISRPRRNRSHPNIRHAMAETSLQSKHLVLPLFFHGKRGDKEEIPSLPGVYRHSLDSLLDEVSQAIELGVSNFALFPAIDEDLKDAMASESANPDCLNNQALKAIRKKFEGAFLISDVAMDPYSSDGHDGVVKDGRILNDESLPILAQMALNSARAGSHMVACSDMMDGRIGYIRKLLDEEGFQDVLVLSYCLKYASSFYGPFRDALESAPKFGDKKTYQMDFHNVKEGLREIQLDEEEGADWLMVKPGLPYLDVLRFASENSSLPVAAYHVSGEYAMLKAASLNGWLDYEACLMESLVSLRRAGASWIFTYGALDAARILRQNLL